MGRNSAGPRLGALLLSAAVLLATGLAWAQTAMLAPGSATPAAGQAEPGGVWTRGMLLGDMGGLRRVLGTYGISLGMSETSEVLGNVTGGMHRGADYDGVTQMSFTLNTEKALDWTGGTLNVNALQIHGRNLSQDNLDTLQAVSNIEAARATRLWELWYQQEVLDRRADVKLGQQDLDQEFMVSQYASLFLNAVTGWPMIPAADLYAGGPAYPLSALGVRLRAHASPALTVLGGVFDDNPPGGPFRDDSALRDGEASGTRFNLGTGALLIGEVQYAAGQSPIKGCNSVTCGLPGTYKLGAWFDTAGFPDQRFDTAGLSLANPLSKGVPRTDWHNFSVYAVVDQTVWRAGSDSPCSVSVFLRPMGAPGDRNLISVSLNAGVTLQAPFAGRDTDVVGIGVAFAQVGRGATQLDRDTGFFSGAPYPVRSNESVLELTYQAHLTPWWVLQPDLQYVINPGSGIQNPANPSRRIANETVLGLRTVITF